jgi:hypothetical protein
VIRFPFPLSHAWCDEQDFLWGHLEMSFNADGQGPETDPARVVRITCWCWRGDNCTVVPPREPS